MMINWTEALSVNVKEIDLQHKYFIGIFNELNESLFSGEIEDSVNATLDRLAAYAKDHFIAEEALLEKADMPELLARQQAEHADLLAKLDILLNQQSTQDHTITLYLDLLTYMKMWLIDHLEGIDRECGFALNAKDIY